MGPVKLQGSLQRKDGERSRWRGGGAGRGGAGGPLCMRLNLLLLALKMQKRARSQRTQVAPRKDKGTDSRTEPQEGI